MHCSRFYLERKFAAGPRRPPSGVRKHPRRKPPLLPVFPIYRLLYTPNLLYSLHRNAQEAKTRMSRGIRRRKLHVNNSSKMRVTVVIIVTITMTI